MKVFKHSGDLGDIIYSLPTIKALGGGTLLLDPTGGLDDENVSWGRRVKTSLSLKSIEKLKPLLEEQPYIDKVGVWEPTSKVNFNLNRFRKSLTNNLSDSHLKAFNLPSECRNEPWLSVKGELHHPEGKEYLITRSLRVHSNHSFWESLDDSIIKNSAFVGDSFEYEVFRRTFGYDIPFWDLSIIDLAKAIKSCKLFLSNQTLGSAIAEGFKKDLIQEVYRLCPLAIFERPGAKYV